MSLSDDTYKATFSDHQMLLSDDTYEATFYDLFDATFSNTKRHLQ